MRTLFVVLAASLALTGCAKDSTGRNTSAAATPRGQACMSQMNQDRSRGRSAPNWNLYDYCMRHSEGS
ncbi:MAG: hypothetical protein JWN73_3241 [Betaproteobacteria bacterium]|nr:hypothetical protein [Betaproteobacteria bacterium]